MYAISESLKSFQNDDRTNKFKFDCVIWISVEKKIPPFSTNDFPSIAKERPVLPMPIKWMRFILKEELAFWKTRTRYGF